MRCLNFLPVTVTETLSSIMLNSSVRIFFGLPSWIIDLTDVVLITSCSNFVSTKDIVEAPIQIPSERIAVGLSVPLPVIYVDLQNTQEYGNIKHLNPFPL